MRRPASEILSLFPKSLLLPLLLLAGSAGAAEHTVVTNGLVFEPADLTIQVGDTVTWTNAGGGLHNVVADDGSFTSGSPSTAAWQFSFTFHQGGTWDYACEVHVDQGMTGTVTVEGIFGDGLESGTAGAWSQTGPGLPNCHCYFSGDCADLNDFCNWGTLTQEDNCLWRENKPEGPGTGCDVDFPGTKWEGGLCDGICTPRQFGSILGLEAQETLIRGIRLWSEALLQPAEAGGGEIHPKLTEAAIALPFKGEGASLILGRQVGDLLGTLGVLGADHQFCHYESYPGEPSPTYPDLSNHPCLAAAARLAVDALVSEIERPGTAPAVLASLASCPEASSLVLFRGRCEPGPQNLQCTADRIAGTAEFLSTPPNNGSPVVLVRPGAE